MQKWFLRASAVALMAISFTSCKARMSADQQAAGLKFYGTDNQRAMMEFKSHLIIPQPANPDGDDINEVYKGKVLEQVKYLFAVFQWHKQFEAAKGIIGGAQKVVVTNVAKTPAADGGDDELRIDYTYTDIVDFEQSYLDQDIKTAKIPLPENPSTIYLDSWPDRVEKGPNFCTDPDYQSLGDFWYFWSPDRPDCPASFKDHLIYADATFKRLPNTTTTYPEYDRLGTPDLLKIYMAQGPFANVKDPKDIGNGIYQTEMQYFKTMGFKEDPKSDANHKLLVLTQDNGRRVELHTAFLNITHRLDTKGEFTDFVKEGLTEGDIFIYNGHSGLGGTLPVSRFGTAKNPLQLPSKYQIFFFDGCSTFAYYNSSYFALKKSASDPQGTKNLEIITTGLEALFQFNPSVSYKLVWHALNSDQPHTWQAVIDDLTKTVKDSNFSMAKYSPHYHVNGDEDNPTTPDAVRPNFNSMTVNVVPDKEPPTGGGGASTTGGGTSTTTGGGTTTTTGGDGGTTATGDGNN